jgi:hypothetical protein
VSARRREAPSPAAIGATLLLLVLVVADWVPLVTGGAWPRARLIGDGAKLAFVLVVTLSVWGRRGRAADPADWRRLAVAFGVIAVGDVLFLLRLHVAGIGVFALAQVALLWRHGAAVAARLRTDGWRRHGRAVAAAAGGALLLIALGAAALAALAPGARAPGAGGAVGGARVGAGAAYALVLAASLAAAWLAPRAGALPGARAVQAAVGMTLFFVCDLTVAAGQLLADPGARAVARAATFLAYAPALWLLALSGRGSWHEASGRLCSQGTPRGEETT